MVDLVKMKGAKSKSERLRIKRALSKHGKGKRGRPAIEGVAREPNGRISRVLARQEPADKLALEVRARHFGVTIDEARDPRVATYIGRLAMMGGEGGGLSLEQYRAAMCFLEIRGNWQRAILSPDAVWEERAANGEEQDYTQVVQRDVARYEVMMKAVQEAQFDNRHDNLYAPLQYIVIEDKELPHMVGALRLVLNALWRHFSLRE